MVVHLRGGRDRDRARLGEEAHLVDGRGRDILEAVLVMLGQPVRNQLIDRRGLDDGAREDMCSNLARLLEQQDAKVVVSGLVRQLFEPDRRAQPGGTCGGLDI